MLEVTDLKKCMSLKEVLLKCKIEGIGPVTAEKIEKQVVNASTFRTLLEEDSIEPVLRKIDGIEVGSIKSLVKSLTNFDFMLLLEDMETEEFDIFKDKKVYSLDELFERALQLRKSPIEVSKKIDLSCLDGLNICITGTLSIPRKLLQRKIEGAGANFQKSVTIDTDILIYSEKDGLDTTKYKAAQKLNTDLGDVVKFMTESEFYDYERKKGLS